MRMTFLALMASVCLALPPAAATAQEPAPLGEAFTQTPPPPVVEMDPLANGAGRECRGLAKTLPPDDWPVIAAIGAAGPRAPLVLEAWADKRLGLRSDGGRCF